MLPLNIKRNVHSNVRFIHVNESHKLLYSSEIMIFTVDNVYYLREIKLPICAYLLRVSALMVGIAILM